MLSGEPTPRKQIVPVSPPPHAAAEHRATSCLRRKPQPQEGRASTTSKVGGEAHARASGRGGSLQIQASRRLTRLVPELRPGPGAGSPPATWRPPTTARSTLPGIAAPHRWPRTQSPRGRLRARQSNACATLCRHPWGREAVKAKAEEAAPKAADKRGVSHRAATSAQAAALARGKHGNPQKQPRCPFVLFSWRGRHTVVTDRMFPARVRQAFGVRSAHSDGPAMGRRWPAMVLGEVGIGLEDSDSVRSRWATCTASLRSVNGIHA